MIERAQGCWLGQLAGDSLGALVEFQSDTRIRRDYPDGVRDLRDGGTWSSQAGQPSDDSKLALMLARTLVREGRIDADIVFAAYVHWYKSNPFDIGGTHRSTSHTTTRPLSPPAAHVSPSGENVSARTGPISQSQVTSSRPLTTSQKRTRPSSPAEANTRLVG